jgi:hypothetical protein
MRRVPPTELTAWLEDTAEPSLGGGYTGYDVDGWDASTWVLNAMYESEVPLPDLSWDKVHQQRVRSGEVEPMIVNGVDLDKLLVDSGQPLGRTRAPEAGWRRLLWSELATRQRGAPLGAIGVPPCYRWFSYGSWPIQIRPFAIGSLDRESFLRLAAILLLEPGASPDQRLWCYYSPLVVAASDGKTPVALAATLAELPEIYDWPDADGSPSNIWPEDRSWFVYSDYDLSGTKVSGSRDLVARVVADSVLETVSYP